MFYRINCCGNNIIVFINAFGNLIGVGDIIPTQPAEEETTVTTTVADITDAEAAEEASKEEKEESGETETTYGYNRHCRNLSKEQVEENLKKGHVC